MALNTEETVSLAGIRVLVVDDDEAICLLAQRLLMSRGAAVETAENGRVALQILLRQDFDVVLVDLRMHEMDGITFVQEARNIWPWLGFIIMTGFMDDVSGDVLTRLNVHRALEKPIRAGKLFLAVLTEYNERRSGMGTLGPGLEQQQRQLRMLGRLSETALAAGTFVEALKEMSDGLGELMASDVAGMFGFSEGQKIMVFSVQGHVSPDFLNAARDEILSRYVALGGQKLDLASLRIQVDGATPVAGAPSVPGRILTIPLLVHNEVQGILLLAAVDPVKLINTDVAFVYQVANVLSSILAAVTRIRQMAAHDSLTGLFNRAYFEEQTERSLQMARRHGYSMALAIMDIDNFKSVNDTHGHPVGDQLLREFAGILKKVARTSDVVARHGGDEFVVLFPQTDLPYAVMLGDRIRKAVDAHVFCEGTLSLKITTSIGLATSRDIGMAASASEMLRLADIALYAAKRDGRNRVRLWSSGQQMDADQAPDDPVRELVKGAGEHRAAHILVLDDDPMIVKVVEAVLRGGGYHVEGVLTAREAVDKVVAQPGTYDAIITDLTLPESSGLEVISQIHQADSLIMAVVMTGFATKDNAVASLREGAFDFIEKPVMPAKLLAVMEKALDHRRLIVENERYRLHLEDMVREKSATLLQTMDQLKQSYDFSLQAMASLLDVREHDTGQHCNRVRAVSVTLGEALGLSGKELETLAHGALLHDIGKIAVPDSILLKPGSLTEDEWKIMKTHPAIGYKILAASSYLAEEAELVYAHQERYDGRGYPRGLKGNEICLGARIFAVVDAYDAMRSHRPYRKSMTPEASARELQAGKAAQFDPIVVDVFLRHLEDIERVGAWPR